MENSLLVLLLPPLLLVPTMGLLSKINSKTALQAELNRKALHMCIGLSALFFPLALTETWMVLSAGGIALVWMCCVRNIRSLRKQFGNVLHGTKRKSYGEMYFAASIVSLLLLADGNLLYYALPLLILTFADTVAAIVGQVTPYLAFSGMAKGKTLSGSAAFLATAFVIAALVIGGSTALTLGQTIVASLLIAVVTSTAEAISRQGADNLTIPLSAFALLHFLSIGA